MGNIPPETPDQAAALDAQQELLEDCLDLVFDVHDEALRDGLTEPVVVLLDCEDPIGGEIARAWLGTKRVEEEILAQRSEELTTVFAQAFAWADCVEEIPAVFAYLAPVFEHPLPAGEFLAISVTAGGASALTVPLSARQTRAH